MCGQEMQTNLAGCDSATPTQCMAIHFIHNIKNTTSITPLQEISVRMLKGNCKVYMLYTYYNQLPINNLAQNKEYHVKINSYKVGHQIPCSFVTGIDHLSKWS